MRSREAFRDELDEIRRQVKGKAADTEPFVTSSAIPSLPPRPSFFPPLSIASYLSTPNLKTLLMSHLLSETDIPTGEGIDLITMLRALPPQTPDTAALLATIAERDAQLAARDEAIRRLQEQVAALEKTLCAQS